MMVVSIRQQSFVGSFGIFRKQAHCPTCLHRPRKSLSSTAATAYPGSTQIDYLQGFDEDGDDYYNILGVDPRADKKTIRKAYHAAMRDCHPDYGHGEEAAEFATFLNEIYETLIDEEKRGDYDILVGFSRLATNPFRDVSFEKGQYFEPKDSAITSMYDGLLMQWDEHGRARAIAQNHDSFDDIEEAIQTCPVNCIHRVTAPQLTLLETVMRKMDRIDAWIMNSGGGHSINVFTEASVAWEKRQSQIRAREQAERQQMIWQMWEPAGGSQSGSQGPVKEARSVLNRRRSIELAERAAKAARRFASSARHAISKVREIESKKTHNT